MNTPVVGTVLKCVFTIALVALTVRELPPAAAQMSHKMKMGEPMKMVNP